MEKHIHGGDVYHHVGCVDFSANCNPLGTPENIKKAIREDVNIKEIKNIRELKEFYKMAQYTYNLHKTVLPYSYTLYENISDVCTQAYPEDHSGYPEYSWTYCCRGNRYEFISL